MSDASEELIILGRLVGACSGWDEHGVGELGFHDVKSLLFGIPDGYWFVDFNKGFVEVMNDDGKSMKRCDLIECLSNAIKQETQS